jgi:phage nucleotide-binding protein
MAIKKTVQKKSILSRATPVTELETVITALFYGRSGSGKTTVAGTFPKPLLILDIGERGTDSLASMDGVDVITVHDWQELEEIYWELKDGESKYKSVVIDAVHTMQNQAIAEARAIGGKKDKDMTSQRDMGQATGLMNQWNYAYRDLRDVGINVVFLAHDRLRETETEDGVDAIAPEVGPNVMPNVGKTLMGAVNIIGYTYIAEVTEKKVPGKKADSRKEYRMLLGANSVFNTKVRSPKENVTPEFIVDPTYDKLVAVIKGSTTTTPTKRRIIKKAS